MAVGREFGPFTLVRKLARGGMADIFLATRRSESGEQFCVIKMMIPSSLRNPKALKMFLGEARLAALLDHPNIVRILLLDRVDDYYFIAMEYIAGETVYHLLHQAAQNRRPIAPMEAAGIIHQCCQGLAYAHGLADATGESLHLVHRDISPSNIIVSYQGQVKILDFGIAAAATRQLKVSKGKALGKYGYMSPEQCRGETQDHRSDLFSLGIVFWELLTGGSLFTGQDPKAITAGILGGNISPPRSVNLHVPEALELVVINALATDPSKRFQSAAQMGEAIRHACAGDMATEAQLAGTLVQLFGQRRAELSHRGEVGQEIDLATLLFDDLQAEDSEEPLEKKQRRERRLVLSPLNIILLLLTVVVLAAAFTLKLVVDSMDPTRDSASQPALEVRVGAVQIDSNPRGAHIALNGLDTGKVTPARIEGLRLGADQEISLSKDGFEHWTSLVRLESEDTRRVNTVLVRSQPKRPPGTP